MGNINEKHKDVNSNTKKKSTRLNPEVAVQDTKDGTEGITARFHGEEARERLLHRLEKVTFVNKNQIQALLKVLRQLLLGESESDFVMGLHYSHSCCGWDELDIEAFVIGGKHLLSIHSGKLGH